MSDEEIERIQTQIQRFKLPVGTSQLVGELQSRLAAIKFKRQAPPPSPIPVEPATGPDHPAVLEMQEVALQIRDFLTAYSSQLEERIPQRVDLPEQQPSVHYEKIKDPRVRRQLLADNIRMEMSLRSLDFLPDFHEEQAFRRFCTFAAYQVEEMLNYYYFNVYGSDISTLISEFKQWGVEVKGFGDDNSKISSIDKIKLFVKINAYNRMFYPGNGSKSSFYNTLANIRNMESHRCSILLKSDGDATGYDQVAVRVIRERNHVVVRGYLENMYTNIID